MKSRVFIVNLSAHDFKEAEKYGELVFLTKGRVNGKKINKHARDFVEKLKGMTSRDWILFTSLQSLNWLLGYIMGRMNINPVNILYYSNKKYLEFQLDFSNLMEGDGENDYK